MTVELRDIEHVECLDCGRHTTGLEATRRTFYKNACGLCGGPLQGVEALQHARSEWARAVQALSTLTAGREP